MWNWNWNWYCYRYWLVLALVLVLVLELVKYFFLSFDSFAYFMMRSNHPDILSSVRWWLARCVVLAVMGKNTQNVYSYGKRLELHRCYNSYRCRPDLKTEQQNWQMPWFLFLALQILLHASNVRHQKNTNFLATNVSFIGDLLLMLHWWNMKHIDLSNVMSHGSSHIA